MANPAIEFTYNGVKKQVEGKASFDVGDGKATFGADFILSEGSAGDLITAVGVVESAFSEMNKAFLLEVGGSTELTWNPAANTGFLTKPRLVKKGAPFDAGLSQLLRLELELQLPPSTAARAGRREATIVLTNPNPDYLRTLEFKGKWTATKSGEPSVQDAKDAFDAGVATWIATWTTALTPVGSWVFHSFVTLEWDDENKVLDFHVKYREFNPTSTPGETTLGVYTIGRFIRNDPQVIGEPLLNTAIPGYAGKGGGIAVGTPTSSPSAQGARVPRRYTAKTKTFFAGSTAKANGYWEAIIRAWIKASVQAIFGTGRVIFERTVVTAIDVEEKAVEADTAILVAATGLLIEYDETVTRIHDARRTAETVWSGTPDDFDIQEGGRQIWIEHQIRQKRLDMAPIEPAFLGSPWVFWHEDNPQKAEVIDPVTDAVVAVEYTHTRRYLYAPTSGGFKQSLVRGR